MPHSPADRTRLVVVLFDGASLGIMSFAFGVFDLAVHYGAIGDRDRAVYAAAYATPTAIRAGNAWYQSFHQDIEDQQAYGTITAPMLGIASLASPYLEQSLTARGSDVRMVNVPTSGHFVPEEAPDAVVDALTTLIG